MKRNVMLFVAAFVLLLCGSTPCLADGGGGPVPICFPGTPCATSLFDGGAPVPICYPGTSCASKLFDGGPEPICYPGRPWAAKLFDGG
ncbi:MAG TPA: hypothetical protein VGR76_14875, partial [Candidatus Angelobacter sp.]|nr:hypothetical protein [Candidatus Angelobacter sp.]